MPPSHPDTPPVDVLIVAHDSGDYLSSAVASVLPDVPPEQILVLDAESIDGSVESVRRLYPQVRVHPLPNRGFAAANNAGLHQTSREFALLLNPDAELQPGALAALLARARAAPRAGIVGAKILNSDGSLQKDSFGRFPTLPGLLRLHLVRLWQRFHGNTDLSPPDYHTPLEVDWVTGACLLVRRRALAGVGGLDERYFLYLEDVDWCRAMRAAGWRVLAEPTAECVHRLGKGGTDSTSARQEYHRSLGLYARKHRLPGLWLLARVQRLRSVRL